ncbi:MAG: hypothetical protein AB7O98_14045 [Hyphomonadaceae bacterium]
MTAILRAIPLLVFPALLYAAVALSMEFGAVRASLDQIFLSLRLPSGADFVVTRGHGLTMLAAGLLFLEVIKSTSASTSSLVENVLAFIAFTVAFIFFLLNPAFGTIEFALIMVMMLVDFMAGFIVMTVSARRDVAFGEG